MSHTEKYLTATKRRPCPVCGTHDYCSSLEDGSKTFCALVSEGSVTTCTNGRYLHVDGNHGSYRRAFAHRPDRQRDEPPSTDWSTYQPLDAANLESLAGLLEVGAEALAALEVGRHNQAWTTPMFNGNRERVGIHVRRTQYWAKKKKYYVLGSRAGLFVPTAALASDELFLPEGMSDTAALLTMGLCAVGRPSNVGGFQHIRDMIRGRSVSLVLVGDNDEAGRKGVLALAAKLRLYTERMKVIFPPEGIKDARAWLQAGGDASAVRAALEAAKPVELRVEVAE